MASSLGVGTGVRDRMMAFKTALAIYLGVYLLLPGCLCQVLTALGVSVHAPAAASQPLPHLVSGSGADGAGAVFTAIDDRPGVCHCDERMVKSAERPVVASAPSIDDRIFGGGSNLPGAPASIAPWRTLLRLDRAPPPPRRPGDPRHWWDSQRLTPRFTGAFVI